MIQRPSIPHLKAMVVDNNILEGQGRGSLKRLPCPFFLKSTLFTNSGRGKPLIMPRPSSSRIKMSIIRAFKWGIICFCTIIGSLLIWRKPKLVFEVYHSNRSPLYVPTSFLWHNNWKPLLFLKAYIMYSGNWLFWSNSYTSAGFLQIEREPMIVQKQIIPHLKALMMDI